MNLMSGASTSPHAASVLQQLQVDRQHHDPFALSTVPVQSPVLPQNPNSNWPGQNMHMPPSKNATNPFGTNQQAQIAPQHSSSRPPGNPFDPFA
jgi:hypothetical protein